MHESILSGIVFSILRLEGYDLHMHIHVPVPSTQGILKLWMILCSYNDIGKKF